MRDGSYTYFVVEWQGTAKFGNEGEWYGMGDGWWKQKYENTRQWLGGVNEYPWCERERQGDGNMGFDMLTVAADAYHKAKQCFPQHKWRVVKVELSYSRTPVLESKTRGEAMEAAIKAVLLETARRNSEIKGVAFDPEYYDELDCLIAQEHANAAIQAYLKKIGESYEEENQTRSGEANVLPSGVQHPGRPSPSEEAGYPLGEPDWIPQGVSPAPQNGPFGSGQISPVPPSLPSVS